MMKSIQKISSFLMALMVLFSTFSFTVHQHYCGDELKDSTLFFAAEKCEMEQMMTKTSSALHEQKEPCCDDVIKLVEGQDELNISFYTLSFDKQLFAATFVYTLNLFEGLEENASSFEVYKPPLVIRELYKIDETYLI